MDSKIGDGVEEYAARDEQLVLLAHDVQRLVLVEAHDAQHLRHQVVHARLALLRDQCMPQIPHEAARLEVAFDRPVVHGDVEHVLRDREVGNVELGRVEEPLLRAREDVEFREVGGGPFAGRVRIVVRGDDSDVLPFAVGNMTDVPSRDYDLKRVKKEVEAMSKKILRRAPVLS